MIELRIQTHDLESDVYERLSVCWLNQDSWLLEYGEDSARDQKFLAIQTIYDSVTEFPRYFGEALRPLFDPLKRDTALEQDNALREALKPEAVVSNIRITVDGWPFSRMAQHRPVSDPSGKNYSIQVYRIEHMGLPQTRITTMIKRPEGYWPAMKFLNARCFPSLAAIEALSVQHSMSEMTRQINDPLAVDLRECLRRLNKIDLMAAMNWGDISPALIQGL